MELVDFIAELEKQLQKLKFVENWEIERKNTTLRVKVFLQRKAFLQVFYNMILRIQSFALIINNERVWGLDHDNKFGWHEHKLPNTEIHEKVNPHSIKQIIQKLEMVWNNYHKES